MDSKTRAMLEAKGWRVGSAREFLGASVAQENFVNTRLNLRRAMIEARKAHGLTQEKLADAMGTTQSRVAQIENGDPSTSVDLMLRALYVMGLSRRDVADAVATDFVEIDGRVAVPDRHAVEAKKIHGPKAARRLGRALHVAATKRAAKRTAKKRS